jgi:cyclopropane fatty-acyl-phospholipid synthase-like methyltransferase
MTQSNSGEFWDQRYRAEGAIWGDDPSPTAQAVLTHVNGGAHVLDVGFGYGRDIAYLARHGCRVSGVDLSDEGYRQAELRLQQIERQAELLVHGKFEETTFNNGQFDAIISHRVAHLLVTREEISQFADKVQQVLRPGGILCIGARNTTDLTPDEMIAVEDGMYEYRQRPGHRIRYWDDDVFRQIFESSFSILDLREATEAESVGHPVPCHVTVMVGRKHDIG